MLLPRASHVLRCTTYTARRLCYAYRAASKTGAEQLLAANTSIDSTGVPSQDKPANVGSTKDAAADEHKQILLYEAGSKVKIDLCRSFGSSLQQYALLWLVLCPLYSCFRQSLPHNWPMFARMYTYYDLVEVRHVRKHSRWYGIAYDTGL